MGTENLSHVTRYLERIKFPGFRTGYLPGAAPLPPPTIGTLKQVHRQHCLNIPFENLSLAHPRFRADISADIDRVYQKLVLRRRGGWCFEMNCLLQHMLTQLGFDCYSGFASVVSSEPPVPPARPFQGLVASDNLGATLSMPGMHQVVFTRLGGHIWLCDVGFGRQGLLEPLPLRAFDDDVTRDGAGAGEASTDMAVTGSDVALSPSTDVARAAPADGEGTPGAAPPDVPGCSISSSGESSQMGLRFRLRRGVHGSAEMLSSRDALAHPEAASHVGWYLQFFEDAENEWKDLFFFTLTSFLPQAFHAFNLYTQQHSEFFRSNVKVSRALEDGKATLLGFKLKIRRAGELVERRMLQSEEERDRVLRDVFGIELE